MKTIRKIAILCMVPVLFACGGKNNPDPTPEPPQRVSETRTLTFVLPAVEDGAAGIFKTAWAAGDQIVVHGEYASEQVTVTLEAGDISSDGKSATKSVPGLYPYQRDDCSSTLYASYPASVSDNLKHCFFYSKFSTTNEGLLAASNSGDTFQFQNLCGALTLSVNGDFEGFRLSTPKKEALGYEFLQVKLTDQEQNYRQYLGDPVIQIDGTIRDGVVRVFLPEGTALDSGITLKLMQEGAFVKIFRLTEPLAVNRGKVVDLGDITEEIQDYEDPFSADVLDLDAGGNANCYIVTAPGSYKFKAVVGNRPTQYVDDAYEATVLWETWNDTQEVTEGSVLTSASYAEDYVIIHTPETLRSGNAVVAVKNSAGQIAWSWHIWIPATAIETASFGGIMGNDLMDRNLGALVAAKAENAKVDPLSYGMVYQWGRKDPFVNSGVSMANTLATIAGAPDEVAPGQITLEESIANPRLLGHVNNGDWLIAPENDLWTDTEKTIYDPCPAGYRVPPMNTAVPFWAGISAQAGWSVSKDYGWMTIGVPATVLPIAGYRDDYSVGAIDKVGVRTLYWTAKNSTDAAGSGNDLRTNNDTYQLKAVPKARLGSVRCVME